MGAEKTAENGGLGSVATGANGGKEFADLISAKVRKLAGKLIAWA